MRSEIEDMKKSQQCDRKWKNPSRSYWRPEFGSSYSESAKLCVTQTLKVIRLWQVWRCPYQTQIIQFVLLWIMCQVKFKDKENETDNSICSSGFQMTLTISGNVSTS